MLFVAPTSEYSATTVTVTGTATTTGGCDGYCRCPNCGYGFVVVRNDYSISYTVEDAEPIAPSFKWWFPTPQSERQPLRQMIQRFENGRQYGRELRHRGTFRNFHK